MWKKTLVLVLAAIVSLSVGFGVGYVAQNGGFADLPAILGFGGNDDGAEDWTGKTLTTGENIVNVRETADPDGKIVATLSNNTEVVCLNQDTEGWCYVQVVDGVEGYALASFLSYVGDYQGSTDTEAKTEKPKTYLKVTAEYATVRSEASEDSDAVATVLMNDVLEQTSEDGDWFGVTTADGEKGYISGSLVAATEADKAENSPRYTVTITHSYANIREEATSDSAQVSKLNQGETATYLGEESGWYYILMEDGTSGYVRNDLASSDAETSE